MEIGRHCVVAHALYHLEEASQASSAFGVADDSLDRPDQELGTRGRSRFLGPEKCVRDGARLVGIADAGAGAVGFEVLATVFGLLGVETSALVSVADELRLRLPIRHGDSARATIRVDARFADDGFDVITVGERLAQRLDEHGCDAFAASIPISACVPHSAVATGAQHVQARLDDELFGCEDEIGASDASHFALPRAQAQNSLVERNQTR